MSEWESSRIGESYNLRLGKILTITVVRDIQSRDNPSPTPYAVVVFGARFVARFKTVDEAKAFAVRIARKHLTEAIADLPS